jgi:hypothetical protein
VYFATEDCGSEVYLYDVYGTLGYVVNPRVCVDNLVSALLLPVLSVCRIFRVNLRSDQGSEGRIGRILPMHIICTARVSEYKG